MTERSRKATRKQIAEMIAEAVANQKRLATNEQSKPSPNKQHGARLQTIKRDINRIK